MSRKRGLQFGFLFNLVSLVVVVIIVHAVYVALVRPRADLILAEQTALMEADPDHVSERSGWVIVRDFEQEACFILMLWAMTIMAGKAVALSREARLLDVELVPLADGIKILPEDAREYARQVERLPVEQQSHLLARALLSALYRFAATRSIQDASDTARGVCESEAERLEAELSMVRYIAWAIPSIGFVGTVRGIGEALGKAHQAVEGQIAGVTQSLGVAFNSTFIALLISIVIMFLLHQLQLQQERLVLDTETYLDTRLVRHLRVSETSTGR